MKKILQEISHTLVIFEESNLDYFPKLSYVDQLHTFESLLRIHEIRRIILESTFNWHLYINNFINK
jgi:hypothetical protein